MAAVFFWLLGAGALLASAAAQTESAAAQTESAAAQTASAAAQAAYAAAQTAYAEAQAAYAEAQAAYERLPAKFKLGADLALEKQNSRPGGKYHFVFFKSLMQSDIDPDTGELYIYHSFYIKATKCPQGTVDTRNCTFRENKPEVECAMCYATFGDRVKAVPEPYISCARKTVLTEAVRRRDMNICNRMGDRTGAPGGIADTGDF
ncbi:hypothetical protein CRUP_029834 [Coryphaenoides rupestris]|nr:hypothetical protein CRUP_029834 [Coryphaenoides rupestris]